MVNEFGPYIFVNDYHAPNTLYQVQLKKCSMNNIFIHTCFFEGVFIHTLKCKYRPATMLCVCIYIVNPVFRRIFFGNI